MSRLILFSGGVESTALLSIADKSDYLMTIVFGNDFYAPSVDLVNSKKIAEMSGLNSVRVGLDLPRLDGMRFVHQLHQFIGICHVLVQAYGFKEVWKGRNSSEPTEYTKPIYDKFFAAWSVLSPETPFLHPLDHLSKSEQLMLIPEKMRSLVVSCAVHKNYVNECKKCMERKAAEDESNRKFSSES